MRDFLLELGVEEIPASHLQPAEDYIRSSFSAMMKQARLDYRKLQVSSTPRRFFLIAGGVQESQEEIGIQKTGPAKSISYDNEGRLSPAALGFLKKNQASAEEIYIQKTDKGEFIAIRQTLPAKQAVELIRAWILELIPQLPFPKKMLWNESRLALSRPLRWICALWDAELIGLSLAGVDSGRLSFGNRYLGLDQALTISQPDEYLELLRQNAVLADRTQRREKLVQELGQVLSGSGFTVVPDERLIDTVTDLVEDPTAVTAEFEARFLSLPEKIISSTISQNQKYFSVRGSEGKLSNKFVFISNGDKACSELIRKGNEKVVKARLADALWYFEEDTKQPLEHYLPRLEEVVFQSKLGSVADKVKRIILLSEYICKQLKLSPEQSAKALRCAKLCKADLVTTMLGEKEFTKLQGYIGKQYALVGNEDPEVAEGIYEHYLPRGTDDGLPQTVSGSVVAVADKVDTVCGIIAIGMLPTGSADPFALRRAANGVVQILVERDWELDLSALIDRALELVSSVAQDADPAKTASSAALASCATDQDVDPAKTASFAATRDKIRSFFLQRVNWLLKQLQLDYDVIDSVMHLSLGSLPDLKRRALALQKFRQREDFIRLVIGFKRAANIIEGSSEFLKIEPKLFKEQAETGLHERLLDLKNAIDAALRQDDYYQAISNLVSFGEHIDRFFDEVLVNCEDEKLRLNRYGLLNEVKSEFLRVADISRIVLENE